MLEPSELHESGYRRFARNVLSFLAGAFVFGCFATFQKIQMGISLVLNDYVIPVVFGGVVGWVIGTLAARQSRRMRELQQQIEKRTQPGEALWNKDWFHEVLRESETGLAKAQAIANLGSWELDLERNELRWSDEVYRIFGIDIQQFGATYESFLDAVHPDDRESVNRTYSDSVKEKTSYEIIHRVLRPDGTVRIVQELCEHVLDGEGNVVRSVGTILDITERKQAEEALRESEENFRAIYDAANDAIFIHEMETGRVIDVNRKMCEMYGYTPEEARLANSGDLSSGESPYDEKHAVELIGKAGAGEPQLFEWHARNKEGQLFWVEVNLKRAIIGENERILAVVRDITERKQAEDALREKERFQEALLDDMQTFVAVLEPNGDVVFVNNTPLKVGGLEFKDVIGKKFCDAPWWTHSDEVHETVMRDIELCRSGESLVHDVQIQIADGSLMWIEYSMHPIYDDHGNVQYLVPEGRDITERKKLEEQFRQSQKMEAVGQLAGGIAHDFNNLLQVINSYSAIALMNMDENDPNHEAITYVANAGDRAAKLVSQILAFSRQQVLDLQDVDLNDVVVDVIKLLRHVLGEHVTLQILAGPELGIIRGDSGQIEQILMNLCVNARDAMPEGGTITIKTENVQIDDDYCRTHDWAAPGNYVRLIVTDTGRGMDDETLKSIFEPFFTTKDVGKGSGLGLSMVYGLVKQHQGLIHIDSEVGKGTVFEIFLPLSEGVAASRTRKTEGPAVGGTETILLAEDNTNVLRVARIMLERAGYTVLTATDGEEALHVFEEHKELIDLALLDVMMPKLGGRAVYEHIRKGSPDLPFLFASGYSSNAIHTNFILDEGLVLIQKPYQLNSLLHAVRATLDAGGRLADGRG